MPDTRRHAPVAGLPFVALVVFVLLAPAAASPQSTPVRPFGGSSFEAAADEREVNATVAETAVEVRIVAASAVERSPERTR